MNVDERLERLVALLLLEQMKGATQSEKATKLSIAGFSNLEIADILQITSARVADALFKSRRRATTKKKSVKRAPKARQTAA